MDFRQISPFLINFEDEADPESARQVNQGGLQIRNKEISGRDLLDWADPGQKRRNLIRREVFLRDFIKFTYQKTKKTKRKTMPKWLFKFWQFWEFFFGFLYPFKQSICIIASGVSFRLH